jgi:hypothetical protein
LQRFQLRGDEVSVAIIGHGTPRHCRIHR